AARHRFRHDDPERLVVKAGKQESGGFAEHPVFLRVVHWPDVLDVLADCRRHMTLEVLRAARSSLPVAGDDQASSGCARDPECGGGPYATIVAPATALWGCAINVTSWPRAARLRTRNAMIRSMPPYSTGGTGMYGSAVTRILIARARPRRATRARRARRHVP